MRALSIKSSSVAASFCPVPDFSSGIAQAARLSNNMPRKKDGNRCLMEKLIFGFIKMLVSDVFKFKTIRFLGYSLVISSVALAKILLETAPTSIST